MHLCANFAAACSWQDHFKVYLLQAVPEDPPSEDPHIVYYIYIGIHLSCND